MNNSFRIGSQTKPIKILQFVNTLEFGGATDYALTLSENISKEKFESYLACGPGEGWETRAEKCSKQVLYLKKMKPTHTTETKNGIFGDILSLVALYKFLRSNRIDIIHSHGSKSRLLGGIAGCMARTPLRIQSAHGFAFNSRQSSWKYFAFRCVERLMGALHHELVLESQHDLSVATYSKLGKSRRCIYTGIPIDKKFNTSLENLRAELGIDINAKIILMVGRLTEQKDPITFVKTANIVNRVNKNTMFVIVGDGDLYSSTSDLIEDKDRVRLLGRRIDVEEMILLSDIYMLCSRWEGIPLTILAALHYGKPVVATNKLGLPEVVIDGVTGYLAEEGVPQSFADAVIRLVDSESNRNKCGNNGMQLIKDRHSLSRMIQEFESLFTSRNFHDI